jgi:hypothetical protein
MRSPSRCASAVATEPRASVRRRLRRTAALNSRASNARIKGVCFVLRAEEADYGRPVRVDCLLLFHEYVKCIITTRGSLKPQTPGVPVRLGHVPAKCRIGVCCVHHGARRSGPLLAAFGYGGSQDGLGRLAGRKSVCSDGARGALRCGFHKHTSPDDGLRSVRPSAPRKEAPQRRPRRRA